MIFNSLPYALFLSGVFVCYWFLFKHNLKAQNLLLLLVSYIFYSWWDFRFLSLILFSSILDYCLGIAIDRSHGSIKQQAQYTGPSANIQWQQAMEWVRDNTAEDAVFSHWWDYGYWVETLGERRTTNDGGHFQGCSLTVLLKIILISALFSPMPGESFPFSLKD